MPELALTIIIWSFATLFAVAALCALTVGIGFIIDEVRSW